MCLFLQAEQQGSDPAVQRFGGIAYSGGVVPNHGWAGDMAIDLSTIQIPDVGLSVLRNHDPDQVVGRAKLVNDGNSLRVVDGTFSEATAIGRETAALAKEGHPWMLSIAVKGDLEQMGDKPKSVKLNGRSMDINSVFRNARALELSFVPAGADPKAYAAQLSARMGVTPPEPTTMADDTDALRARITELETANAQLTVERDAARTASAELSRKHRDARITSVFGAEPELTEAQLNVYRSMNDEQFETVVATLARTTGADGQLFQQTATSGRDPEGSAAAAKSYAAPLGFSVDQDRATLHAKAKRYQAEHAGTDYLTAITAVSN